MPSCVEVRPGKLYFTSALLMKRFRYVSHGPNSDRLVEFSEDHAGEFVPRTQISECMCRHDKHRGRAYRSQGCCQAPRFSQNIDPIATLRNCHEVQTKKRSDAAGSGYLSGRVRACACGGGKTAFRCGTSGWSGGIFPGHGSTAEKTPYLACAALSHPSDSCATWLNSVEATRDPALQ